MQLTITIDEQDYAAFINGLNIALETSNNTMVAWQRGETNESDERVIDLMHRTPRVMLEAIEELMEAHD